MGVSALRGKYCQRLDAMTVNIRKEVKKLFSYEELGGVSAPEWPYPIRYGVENRVSADVVILGGGIAGCHAAINAAKRGMKVVVVDKGAVITSGSGGAGC